MKFTRRHLTWPNVALTLALVFVMTGGAYAAKKYIITSTKQISPSVLKALAGKAGPAGAPGAPGTQGPAGANGANGGKGEQGPKGDQGAVGPAGPNGVTGANGAPGATGPKGTTGTPGLSIPGETGATGPTGPEGSPWTAGGTLPSGKSEKGTWAVTGVPATLPILEEEALTTSVSFLIPLVHTIPAANVHVVVGEVTGTNTGCPTGSQASQPEAEPGNLCVFINTGLDHNFGEMLVVNGETGEIQESGKTGAFLIIKPKTTKEAIFAVGTWAVTAE